MSWRQQRKARRIYNPQSLHTNNSSLRVYHRHSVIPPAHATRTRSVPILVAAFHDILQDIFVAGDIRARHDFFDCHGFQCFCREERTSASEGLDCDFAVGGMGEVVWVNDRGIERGVGSDVYPAA